jgi:hypothetical protein
VVYVTSTIEANFLDALLQALLSDLLADKIGCDLQSN